MKSSDDYDYQIEPAVLGGGDVGKIDWVIRDFLARGAFVLLAAEFGSGKSTLIYRAAEAIYKGELFLDQLPTSRGKVLVIQGDEPHTDAVKKFRRMGLETPFERKFKYYLPYYPPSNKTRTLIMSAVEGLVKK